MKNRFITLAFVLLSLVHFNCSESPTVTLYMSISYSNQLLDSNSFVLLFKDTVTNTIKIPPSFPWIYYKNSPSLKDFEIDYDINWCRSLMNHTYYLLFCYKPGDTVCVDTISFPGGYQYFINFGIHPHYPYVPTSQNYTLVKQDSIIYDFTAIGLDTVSYFHAHEKWIGKSF